MAQNYLMLVEALFAEDVPPAPRMPAAMPVPRVRRRALWAGTSWRGCGKGCAACRGGGRWATNASYS